MYLISVSDFSREYSIPNVNEVISENSEVLNLYIEDKVRLLLQEILGHEEFTDFDNNVENGELKADAEQKWKDFVNGKDKFKGLIFQNGLFKSSMLIPYVFYHWLTDNISTVTGTGEKALQATNANNFVSTQRANKAWNTFVNMYQGEFGNRPFKGWFNGVRFCDYYGSYKGYLSVSQFLRENKETYPNAVIPYFELKNSLGL